MARKYCFVIYLKVEQINYSNYFQFDLFLFKSIHFHFDHLITIKFEVIEINELNQVSYFTYHLLMTNVNLRIQNFHPSF